MLKRLAVRSGLGQYGRNNICYVDGMGSFTTLLAYFTDYNFLEDHFQDVSLMRRCLKCNICRRKCPTQCIPDKDFIIDAGRCVTLYNEIEGEFPEWLPANAHNALMGCMRCQFDCPQNRDVITKSVRLQDVTEEETHKILAGTTEPELLATLSEKLQYYYPATDPKYFPIFTRNLGVLIQ
jgi:epoxyqueuosine reductase